MSAVLHGRRAVVTGAASGIGRATAELFAGSGAAVVLVDRDEAALASVAEALAGEGHVARIGNVTDEEAWVELAALLEGGGGCDILVNNAGRATLKPLLELSYAEWRAELAVNLESVFLSTRALLPLLARSGRGAIVNVSSIRGIVGAVNAAAYCASKGAVRMFTKAAALECAALGNGVRVNSVHPGLVDTPLANTAFADPAKAAQRLAALPMGRPGTPQEIAEAILFAASDAAAYMTGAEMAIDGGTVAQ